MEHFDEERFVRGPRSLSSLAPAEGEALRQGRREERVGSAGVSSRLRVTGHDAAGRAGVQEEVALLEALRSAGLGAAPVVLEVFDGGYDREDAAPLRRGGGRRSAAESVPPTGERLAQARARSDLEALLDVLHARGWVLAAPRGEGLGVRADGSVVVRALAGLRRDDELAARQADRLWLDSVLGDGERTLRRRVDTPGTRWEPPPGLGPGPRPAAPQPDPATAHDPAPGPEAPAPALPVPRTSSRRRPRAGDGPAGAPRRGDRGGHRRPGRGRAAWRTVRGVLSEARHRRTALLSALIALLLGGVLTGGLWWSAAQEQTPPPAASRQSGGSGARNGTPGLASPDTTQADPAAEDSRPADGEQPPTPITDPWALAAELAGARHAYVTGLSPTPASTPGSESFAADLEVREAYSGVDVRGGGPVVHEAELLEGPTGGEAVLRVQISTPAHELVHPDGTVQEVPATTAAELTLGLRWDGQQWRIQQVRDPGDGRDGSA